MSYRIEFYRLNRCSYFESHLMRVVYWQFANLDNLEVWANGVASRNGYDGGWSAHRA